MPVERKSKNSSRETSAAAAAVGGWKGHSRFFLIFPSRESVIFFAALPGGPLEGEEAGNKVGGRSLYPFS